MAEKEFITQFNASLGKIQQLVQDRQTNSNQLIALITQNISTIDGQIAELENVSASVASKFQQLKQELQASKEMSAEQQRKINECNSALEQRTTARAAIQEELDALKQNSKAELEARQQKIDEYEQNLRELTTQIEPLKQQIQQLTQQKTELEAQVTDLTKQREEKDGIIAGIAAKDKQIQDLTADVQAKIAQIEELTRAIEEKEAQIRDLNEQNANKEARIQELEKNLAEINAEKDKKEQELVVLRAENQEFIDRIMAATRVINESMDLLDQMRTTQREDEKAKLLAKFKSTSDTIQRISGSLQGIDRSSGGGKKYKKYKKTKKSKKTKRKYKGGYTYSTPSSRKKSKSSFNNRRKNKTKKYL
jgi:DNA repair exonuclease SbcCD ATPase subunit